MTIRMLHGRYEVKLPLAPDGLLVVSCDSLELAQRVDRIGPFYERVVNEESCDLDETTAALDALRSAGLAESALFERIATVAARLRAEP
jgi:hypothetical protein